jgi:predicted transcriptional regulator of viral defense system
VLKSSKIDEQLINSLISAKSRGAARLSVEIEAAEKALKQKENQASTEAWLLQEQARRKEEQANKAAAAMIASQMAADMEAERSRKEAEESEKQRVQEQV